MNFKQIITAAAILALPLTASAATLVVPAAGNVTGAYGSSWQSDLTLHSTSQSPVVVTLQLRDGSNTAPYEVTLAPRSTKTVADVVKTAFGRTGTTGAIEITVADRDARRLAITSRTINTTAAGTFGQDIPVLRLEEAAAAGDIVAITGPASAAAARFNVGVYATTPASVKWDLVRADGTVAATRTETYTAGAQRQYSSAAVTFFATTPADNDTVHATLTSGRAMFFGSTVEQQTGDPTFVPAAVTRDTIQIHFGVDLDRDGVADITDADGDGVLDSEIELLTSTFAQRITVLAEGEFGEAVTLELVSAPLNSAEFVANQIHTGPPGVLKGRHEEIVLRAIAGGTTSLLRIPVRYR